jgi:uncharacterized membrane protein
MAQPHILVGASETAAEPVVRRIAPADLMDALASGLRDFAEMPTHALFLCLVYPAIGILLASATLGFSVLPLLYPMAAGFALLGPIAAIGLYELSRRREAGLEASASDALEVVHSPSIGAIVALGLLLTVIFFIWVATANAIWVSYMGYARPESIGQFLHDVLLTSNGWGLIVVGNLVGFLFAVLVLTISVVSFPLLLDRDVGAATAVSTSIRAVLASPLTMALWGMIVAGLLFVGSLPLFLGLPIVLPVLGHATWHLYRKAVEPDPNPRQDYAPKPKGRRYAADFPASLFSRGDPDPR